MSINLKLIETVDTEMLKRKLKRFQRPINRERSTNQLFVVASEELIDWKDPEKGTALNFMYDSYPPTIATLAEVPHVRLYDLAEEQDARELVWVWHHTSRLHESPLLTLSLKDLGIESLEV